MILSFSTAHKSQREMVPTLLLMLSLCLEAMSGLSSPLTLSIPMWAGVDESQGNSLPEETIETL